MNVDYIVKNARLFTANVNNANATCFAVKDGKFVYVGDENGSSDLIGEVRDAGNKFICPAFMDSHVHITVPIVFMFSPESLFIHCNGKNECLKIIENFITEHPGQERYNFDLPIGNLNGEKLTRYDLDAICSDKEIVIVEGESHSAWVNSKVMANNGITDETPDVAPGLSYYERDENGHKTGYLVEMTEAEILMGSHTKNITDEQIKEALMPLIEFSKKQGICAYFDAGTPGNPEFSERVYTVMSDMDKKGELPIYVDGCYLIYDRKQLKDAIEVLKHLREKFSEGNVRVNTLKIMMDGTLAVHTASLVTPYADTGTVGGCLFNTQEIVDLLKKLNENGFDLHVHTVGEGAIRTILDAVEIAKNELKDSFKVHVTCAHLELMDDAEMDRFAKLGVTANFSAWWHSGAGSGGGSTFEDRVALLGEERAAKKALRSKSLWDTGAMVCWSSDNVTFGDFRAWSPYLGMESAITRLNDEKTNINEEEKQYIQLLPASECMNHEEMLIGYTINNARQLNIENIKGSIDIGKDADYLIFDEDMLSVDPRGMSYILPKEVFFKGIKVN